MTATDAEAFNQLLGSLGEVFNETISSTRALLYFGALSDYPLDVVRAAVLMAIKSKTFFPKPAELIEIIAGRPEDQALAAWTRVESAMREVGSYQSVTFDDPILHAAIGQMGGWHGAWAWERLEEREYGFKRLEFTRYYRLFLDRGVSAAPRYLLGQAELTNREDRGLWARGLEHIDEIVQLGVDGRPTGILPSEARQALQGTRAPLPLLAADEKAVAPPSVHDVLRSS